MRMVIVAGAAVLALAGCSKANDPASPVPSAATTPAADGSFKPPRTISRLDYGSRMERRFRKLDKNQDGKLAADEFPRNRGARLVKRLDKNGDGTIDATEWSDGMLARFDKRDANKDGNLTTDETGRKGGGRRAERLGGIDDDSDEVDNGL